MDRERLVAEANYYQMLAANFACDARFNMARGALAAARFYQDYARLYAASAHYCMSRILWS